MNTAINDLFIGHRTGTLVLYGVAFAALFTEYTLFVLSLAAIWTIIIYREELILTLKVAPRDIHFTFFFIKLATFMDRMQRRKMNAGKLFQTWAKKFPNKPALIHEDVVWTFEQADQFSNRVSNYFKSAGVNKGDVVALIMENRPEYVMLWLGMVKIGIVVSLINTNQRKEALLHSLKIVNAKAIIYGSELTEAISEISEEVRSVPKYMYKTDEFEEQPIHKDSMDLNEQLKLTSSETPQEDMDKCGINDQMLFIYTSGTTGMPKAAVITHQRSMYMSMAMKFAFNIKDTDIIYTTLPLYHTAGGVLGLCQCLYGGSTSVIKTKFSATNFWKDCVKHKCTVAQYIGELCRYLLSAPERPEEQQHELRLMYGNGLRPAIWHQFVDRFKIKQVGEIYGSTEGNANLINAWNKPGSVGYIPFFAEKVYPVYLIKSDPVTNEAIRDKNGLCILCKADEPGLLVGKINKNQMGNIYEGYTDKKASRGKIIYDVFEKGDSVFNTGDILVKDKQNYYYFKDRTGDTFRWKGENVATTEVEAAISNVVQLRDTVVYGVEIPNTEGKAGMAAIADPENKLDFDRLAEGARKTLPAYARPMFIRIMKDVNITGTYKLMKVDLQKDGYNPDIIPDPLYYYDSHGKYVPLTSSVYNDIINGKIKL